MPAERQTRDRLWAGARYALACLLLLGLFHSVDVANVWQTLQSISPAMFAGALLALTIARWLGALRTRRLATLHDIPLSTARLFEISCVSSFYGIALPGSFSGGIVRWYRIGALHSNHSGAAALVVFERMIAVMVLAVLGIIGWSLDARAIGAIGIALFLGLIAACLFSFCLASLSRIPSRISSWIASNGSTTGGVCRRILSAFERSLDAAAHHRDRAVLAWTIALSVAVHLVAACGLYTIATTLHLDLGYATILWLRACTIIVTAIPLTPAGLGVREVTTVALLGLLGVEAGPAVAFSVLQFAGMLFFSALGALFEARRQLLRPPSRSTTDARAPG